MFWFDGICGVNLRQGDRVPDAKWGFGGIWEGAIGDWHVGEREIHPKSVVVEERYVEKVTILGRLTLTQVVSQ